ncbi:MAG: hypothetical protein HDT30_12285 [Clostridiales bacterium]|nr:hypothetical protein [Clostridiales bacterium]
MKKRTIYVSIIMVLILSTLGEINVNCKTKDINPIETESEIIDAKNTLDAIVAEGKEEIIEEVLDELSTSNYWKKVLNRKE